MNTKLTKLQKKAKSLGLQIHILKKIPLPIRSADPYEWYSVLSEFIRVYGHLTINVEGEYAGYDGGYGEIYLTVLTPIEDSVLEIKISDVETTKANAKKVVEDREKIEYERLKKKFENIRQS